MKKITKNLLALMLSLLMVSCGNTTPSDVPGTDSGASTNPPVTETEPATEAATETEPATEAATETEPATEPIVTEPTETVPATEPEETQPEVTEPAVMEPTVTEPEETEPKPTDPPEVTEPKPTDPKPTEPPKVHTHSYKAKVVEPTCEENGYTVHTCSCGDSYTDSEVDALGHDMREDINEPGPGYEGYTYHFCSRCDYSYKDNFVDALPEVTTEDIQKAIIKYINQYRAEQGSTQLTYLPGMTNVAKYRSKQLTTNFAHDTADMREAAAYYEYGEWVDPADYGDPNGEGYYRTHTQEAIGYAGFGGSSDEIGKAIAKMFYESSGHWRYLGSSEYSYTGVGVARSGGLWYICVMVGRVNYG
jgi:uncharacterized protein YkwD